MRFGPLSLNRRRTLRGLAGFVVALLLAGQAMAATGCCGALLTAASFDVTSSAPACPDHPMDADPGAQMKHVCPADEPTPQVRAVDVPSAQFIVAIIDLTPMPASTVAQSREPALTTVAVPPPPLYARPHRLRL